MQMHKHGKNIQASVVENNVEAHNGAINQYNVHSVWFDVGYDGGC
jgi:hypothetical protein